MVVIMNSIPAGIKPSLIGGLVTSSSVGGGLVASIPFKTSLNIPSPPTATTLK